MPMDDLRGHVVPLAITGASRTTAGSYLEWALVGAVENQTPSAVGPSYVLVGCVDEG